MTLSSQLLPVICMGCQKGHLTAKSNGTVRPRWCMGQEVAVWGKKTGMHRKQHEQKATGREVLQRSLVYCLLLASRDWNGFPMNRTLPAEPRAQATRPGYIAGLHGAPGPCSAELAQRDRAETLSFETFMCVCKEF